jgi:dTDP-4-amino-4,6-dideoxygalactose transaminase
VIAFRELRRETLELGESLREAVDGVLVESRFVGGGAIAAFERDFAEFCGASHAIGVSSGADAITVALLAAGIGPGDEVITAANTCVPTVLGIAASGATPVLADVDPHTLTLDLDSVRSAVGARTRAVVPVHLYGRRAEVEPLLDLGVRVIEDAAQAHGAAVVADVAAFSFYPTKNLGGVGDAGAVVTSNHETAVRARQIREARAAQSRLDTIQAAVLSVKLAHLTRWNERRAALAARYDAALRAAPVELLAPAEHHAHHLYVVRTRGRDGLRARLLELGVETLVHYPLAVHQHSAWAGLDRPGRLAESERAAAEVLSLPLYPQLTEAEVDAVAAAVVAA